MPKKLETRLREQGITDIEALKLIERVGPFRAGEQYKACLESIERFVNEHAHEIGKTPAQINSAHRINGPLDSLLEKVYMRMAQRLLDLEASEAIKDERIALLEAQLARYTDRSQDAAHKLLTLCESVAPESREPIKRRAYVQNIGQQIHGEFVLEAGRR